MKQPHKHAELIKAWADGAVIEAFYGDGKWEETASPVWNTQAKYRIKPEPKPDVVESLFVIPLVTGQTRNDIPHNLRLTFDGETGKLKKAEVLK